QGGRPAMNELRSIIANWKDLAEKGRRSVLLSLVDVVGSSCRRPGARMLADEEGWLAGHIGGGCLEGDLLEHARAVLSSGDPKIVTYDLSESGELAWGLGIGCPGKIVVLIELFDEVLVTRFESIAYGEEALVPVTVFQTNEGSLCSTGERWIVRSDGSIDPPLPKDLPTDEIDRAAREVLEARKTTVRDFGDDESGFRALVEYLAPPLKLVVFGSGQDTTALLVRAADLGWEATVVDPGAVVEARRRVPDTVRVITAEPATIMNDLGIDDRTAVVMLSHQFKRDIALLEYLARSPVPYVGLIGAYARRDALLSALSAEDLSDLEARLHAPVGLDIGGEGPEEIALSIAAEILAVFNGRSGGFLRAGKGSIHGRLEDAVEGA
ncbi:XdhC family protein, partial [Candidatus Zixiibacteriota bacterium]